MGINRRKGESMEFDNHLKDLGMKEFVLFGVFIITMTVSIAFADELGTEDPLPTKMPYEKVIQKDGSSFLSTQGSAKFNRVGDHSVVVIQGQAAAAMYHSMQAKKAKDVEHPGFDCIMKPTPTCRILLTSNGTLVE